MYPFYQNNESGRLLCEHCSIPNFPLTNDPRQVFTVDVVIDGIALHARMEIRYLSALDQWVISIWDNATSVLLVNQVPLICSYQG